MKQPPKSASDSWFSPDKAPRDGTQILGDFGWPWPSLAAWDEYGESWCTMMLQCCPMENGKYNYYFEMETEDDKSLKRWIPLPKLPK
jgi:hypothetical protein